MVGEGYELGTKLNGISAKRSLDTELQIKAYEINVILKCLASPCHLYQKQTTI
jgi:hypothetical protein